jgi:hypothetical protein
MDSVFHAAILSVCRDRRQPAEVTARWRGVASQFPITRLRHKNRTAEPDQVLTWYWSIGPIRSYELLLESSSLNLAFMTVSLATACFALLAAVMHFVSYKLKKTAERKTFHVKDAV